MSQYMETSGQKTAKCANVHFGDFFWPQLTSPLSPLSKFNKKMNSVQLPFSADSHYPIANHLHNVVVTLDSGKPVFLIKSTYFFPLNIIWNNHSC